MSEPKQRLVDLIETVELRWYERSTKRHYAETDDEVIEREAGAADVDQVGVETSIGYNPAGEENSQKMLFRQQLTANLAAVTCFLDAALEFTFTDNAVLDEDTVRDFVGDMAYEYLLGILRAALADATQSVGLSAVLIPTRGNGGAQS